MHNEPDLEALRALALVAKESSMSAASAQLGVSQQAVSLRIRKLETDLRVRLLVRSARGSRLTPAGELVVGWGTTLLTAADVRQARLHDARHTAASLLLQQGVPARVAMEVLGHSPISLTLGTYSHVVPELAEDAARRMGEALWG